MSSEEMLVIVGGLFLGYLIVTIIIEKKSNAPSQEPNENERSNSFKKDTSNDKSTHQHTNQEPSSKENYIPTSWYRVLEVSESASLSEITIQYKRKIRDYHPDKVASLGEELRELAEFKSKEINSAYEYAKNLKN
jgi:DnaJ-domain-containing protein 1